MKAWRAIKRWWCTVFHEGAGLVRTGHGWACRRCGSEVTL